MCEFSHCGNRSVGITAQTQWRPKQIFVWAAVETVILTACASRETSSIHQCVFVARRSNQITLHRPKKLKPSLRKRLWSVLSVSLSFHFLNSALYIFFSHTNQRHVLFPGIHDLVLPCCSNLTAFLSLTVTFNIVPKPHNITDVSSVLYVFQHSGKAVVLAGCRNISFIFVIYFLCCVEICYLTITNQF